MSHSTNRKDFDRKVGPPNLVPIMNLVTILIPFLLLTVTFVHLAVVDSSLPAISVSPSPHPTLGLTVAITDRGYVVAGRSAILGEEATPLADLGEAGERQPTLARLPDGSYPTGELTELLVRVKSEHPDEQNVVLMPENQVSYDVIIQTMDATRDHHPAGAPTRELLFPFVVMAGGMTQ